MTDTICKVTLIPLNEQLKLFDSSITISTEVCTDLHNVSPRREAT